MKAVRTEWKYLCSQPELETIQARVSAVLPKDAHAGSTGIYAIHSLYFDDYRNSFARENEAGSFHRKKYRLRYYGDDRETVFLECKEKQGDLCCKQSCRPDSEELRKILAGQWQQLFWYTEQPLLKQLALVGMTRCLLPRAIVDYERTAFVDELTHIRITLDRNISVSDQVEQFLTGDYRKLPLLEQHRHVLEVKFDTLLPGHLRALVTPDKASRTAFSKYYLGRKRLQLLGPDQMPVTGKEE